jgi:hypothetical protein
MGFHGWLVRGFVPAGCGSAGGPIVFPRTREFHWSAQKRGPRPF